MVQTEVEMVLSCTHHKSVIISQELYSWLCGDSVSCMPVTIVQARRSYLIVCWFSYEKLMKS